MKKNKMDEQLLSVSPFTLQPLVLREKKKTMMKKNENKNEIDDEEMEEIRDH